MSGVRTDWNRLDLPWNFSDVRAFSIHSLSLDKLAVDTPKVCRVRQSSQTSSQQAPLASVRVKAFGNMKCRVLACVSFRRSLSFHDCLGIQCPCCVTKPGHPMFLHSGQTVDIRVPGDHRRLHSQGE